MAIVDDVKEQIDIICNLISIKCEILSFTNEMDFLKYIELNNDIDILFLDILLNHLNGIEIAKHLNKIAPNLVIVFISSQSEFHEYAYEAEHIWFLDKPINENKLNKVIDKALSKISRRFFLVGAKKIYLDTICYIESKNKNVVINYIDNGFDCFPSKLDDFMQRLPCDLFFRCHKSYIINKTHTLEIKENNFIMKNGVFVKISRPYLKISKNMFTKWLCEL